MLRVPSRGRRGAAVVLSLTFLTVATACAPADEEPTTEDTGAASGAPGSGESAQCTPDDLETLEPGTLTIGTSDPAYEPWMVDNDPTNKQGYESAVAYAVAAELGYGDDAVSWVRVPFDAAVQPGPKPFDFDINQFSITPERAEAVDFSSPYYEVRQAIVAVEGNPAAEAASLADLKDVRIGAMIGTTSIAAVNEFIQPTSEPDGFNSNDDTKLALDNGQVDAIAVDLPTAFYLTAAEIEGGVIVGQLPQPEGEAEEFGLILDLESPLTDCVSQAVDTLREAGTPADLEAQWLADVAGAPELP
jgi:polar amino acid transport system substrate-binding protein